MSELVAARMAADSSVAVKSDSPQQTGHDAAKNLFQRVWGVNRPPAPNSGGVLRPPRLGDRGRIFIRCGTPVCVPAQAGRRLMIATKKHACFFLNE